ncbi:bactofilin family protein [Dongia deserti]|uniref:bactofilin family protein n=1 Tax=Dongia deserti TaxID=2268030 RepID=UPI000E65300C|nr:polymer-forming cytoskeletal protein [Dongia deserti]
MFGKKKDQDMSTPNTADTPPTAPAEAKSYLRQDAPTPGVSRPAEIARRPPDLSAFTQRREQPPAPRAGETDHKKLIVGREIILNGEIRTCDFLVVEGRVEAVLNDCRQIDIASSGQFKGSADIESADISGRFDGDLTVHGRLTVRATGRVFGKVKYGQLEVERGGIISGTVESLPEASTSEAAA